MKCAEILERLEEAMPLSYAESWDNPGLNAGRSDKEIKKVLIALDAVSGAVERAIETGADLILTHHPLIFRGMMQINDRDIVGARLLRLLRNDICCIAMHTNYDVAPGCMADISAELLGIKDCIPLQITGEGVNGEILGVGRIGEFDEIMDFDCLIERVKSEFSLPFAGVYGEELIKGGVKRAAISPGSGKGMYKDAIAGGAQVLITGDITHHEGIDAAESKIAIINAGHYGLEHIFIKDMKDRLMQIEPGLKTECFYGGFPERIY